jgi:nicotinamidase-related amidase
MRRPLRTSVTTFTGSDLAVVLTAGGIDTLVLAGAATSGVELSTVRQAADLDYQLTVLSDGCLDADHEVHASQSRHRVGMTPPGAAPLGFPGLLLERL